MENDYRWHALNVVHQQKDEWVIWHARGQLGEKAKPYVMTTEKARDWLIGYFNSHIESMGFRRRQEAKALTVARIYESVIEKLSEIEHDRWSGQAKTALNDMTDVRRERWGRLANIPYCELSEEMKALDRMQVDEYWPTIADAIHAALPPDQSARIAELEAGGKCTYAKPGRGDCEHAVGLPGKAIHGKHDGPDDTVDCYGKPNGWCWHCWLMHQKNQLETQRARLMAALEDARDDVNEVLNDYLNQSYLRNKAELIAIQRNKLASIDALIGEVRGEAGE